MNATEKTLERVQKLIDKGKRIAPSDMIGLSLFGSDRKDAAGWRAQAMVFLADVFGAKSLYYMAFMQQTQKYHEDTNIREGLGILRSVKEDIENGYLQTHRGLISAELLGDFLEQAEHLHDNGYLQPAASLAGAALENGLREIARGKGVALASREDLSTLTGKLADRDIISRIEQKQLSAMTDIRNAADHGEFDKFDADDVTNLIRDARAFLAKHAT